MAKIKYKLTPEQESYVKTFEALLFVVTEAQKRIKAHLDQCKHVIDPTIHNTVWQSDSAVCELCNTYFGWKCPDSPDHVCHYYTEKTDHGPAVTLIHDNKWLMPADYEGTHESDDWCVFCGDPEERK